MPRLKNHLPYRARNHKSLCALRQDLHAPGMWARLNDKPCTMEVMGLGQQENYLFSIRPIELSEPMSRADSRLMPSQWKTLLQCNAISHWLGTNLQSALMLIQSWPDSKPTFRVKIDLIKLANCHVLYFSKDMFLQFSFVVCYIFISVADIVNN